MAPATRPVDLDLLASRMAALGNRTRLAAYRHLVRAGASGLAVAAVQERLGVPASTLSHHLRRLCEVGLVQQERRGTTLLCRADYDAMGATFEWLADECCVDGTAPGARGSRSTTTRSDGACRSTRERPETSSERSTKQRTKKKRSNTNTVKR